MNKQYFPVCLPPELTSPLTPQVNDEYMKQVLFTRISTVTLMKFFYVSLVLLIIYREASPKRVTFLGFRCMKGLGFHLLKYIKR